MTNALSPDSYLGRNAVDRNGDKIGSIGQVYLDDATGQPDWVTVNTGLFGHKEKFVPLAGASSTGDDVVLPFDKDVVKDAPDIADADHLDEDEERMLYDYYGQHGALGRSGSETSVSSGQETDRRTDSAGLVGTGTTGGPGHDVSGPSTDDAMTRSEEHLQVGTERVEAGRARLRKYVVTEQETVTVPVTREEVRVEREPITDANGGGRAATAVVGTEEEHEVVLTEERPVVTTEAVPVERVRLDTETVTEQQTVTGDVRKEEIAVDDPTTGTGRDRI
ncbi:DUF2382 domain-containing protein [Nakamurella flava]|uniref:DUF2382 domain-containing protein n=1 Tax=Nakamurella flava TaxID=2576308 RepID=A0A4V6CR85_9ACTN|nr:PRC and DUF2382 domain-containing protein [Nakamurella flava]TKV56415.1 DUF2382 domain-containing protein [Nakamurella flava]